VGAPIGSEIGGVTGLAFSVRTAAPGGTPTPTECSVTSPRFSIRWRDSISGMEGFSFAHCGVLAEMLATPEPPKADGSTYEKRTVLLLVPPVPPTAFIISLAILWDDSGSSHIDNIEVTDTTNGCPP